MSKFMVSTIVCFVLGCVIGFMGWKLYKAGVLATTPVSSAQQQVKTPICVAVSCNWQEEPDAGGVTSKVGCAKDFEATRINSQLEGKVLVSCACCTTK